MLKQKRLALINDLTGFGRCSLAVELPIISALKIQVCLLPTAILSVHTGFENYFMSDFTDNTKNYIENWKINNLDFDGLATGFFGSSRQISLVLEFIKKFPSSVIIDPVMGDHGRIYKSYTFEMCQRVRGFLKFADLITPNLTEACELLDVDYPENGITTSEKISTIALNIAEQTRGKRIVITGIVLENDEESSISNLVLDRGKITFINSKRIGSDRSGTGDVFFAVLIAAWINGESLVTATQRATEFVTKCIIHAEKLNLPWNYGLPFEEFLSEL